MKILLRIFSILFFITSVSASFQIDDIKINNRSCPFENGHYTYTPSVGNPLQFKIENQQTVFGTTRIIFSGDAEGTLEAPLSYKEEPLTFSDLNYDPATKVSDYIEQLRQHTHTTATYVWNENKQVRWGTLRPVIFFSRTAPLTFYDEWALKHDEKGHISHLEVPYQVGEESRGALRIHRFCHGVSSTPEKDCFYHDGHRLKSVALAVYSLGQTEWRQANGIANDYSYQSVEHSQVVAHALGSVLGGRGYVRLKSQKNMPCSYLHIGANGAYSIPHQQEAKAKRLELIHQAGENPVFTEEAGDVTFNYVQDSGMPVDVGSVTVQGNRREGFYHLSETAGSDAIAQTWTRQFMPSGSHIIKMTGKERPFQLVDLSRFLANSLSGKNAAEILGFFRPHRGEQPYVKTIRADFSHLPRDSQKKATQKLVQIREKSPNSYQYRDLKELFFDNEIPLNRQLILWLAGCGIEEPPKARKVILKENDLAQQLDFLNDKEVNSIRELVFDGGFSIQLHLDKITSLVRQNPDLTAITFAIDLVTNTDADSVRTFLGVLAEHAKLKKIITSEFTFTKKLGNFQRTIGSMKYDKRRSLLKKLRGLKKVCFSVDGNWNLLGDICENNKKTIKNLDFSNCGDGDLDGKDRVIEAVGQMEKLRTIDARRIDIWNSKIFRLCQKIATLETVRNVKMSLPYYRWGNTGELVCIYGSNLYNGSIGEKLGTVILTPVYVAMSPFLVVGDVFSGGQSCEDFYKSRDVLAGMKNLRNLTLHIYNNRKNYDNNRQKVFSERTGNGFRPLALTFDKDN